MNNQQLFARNRFDRINRTASVILVLLILGGLILSGSPLIGQEQERDLFLGFGDLIYRTSTSSPSVEKIGPGHAPFPSISGNRVLAAHDGSLIRYKRTTDGWEREQLLDSFPSQVRWYRHDQASNRWVAATRRHVISGAFRGSSSPVRIFSVEEGKKVLGLNPDLSAVAVVTKRDEKNNLISVHSLDNSSRNNDPIQKVEVSFSPSPDRRYLLSPDGSSLRGVFQNQEMTGGERRYGRFDLGNREFQTFSVPKTPTALCGRVPGTADEFVLGQDSFLFRHDPETDSVRLLSRDVPDKGSVSVVPRNPRGYEKTPPSLTGFRVTGYGKHREEDGEESFGWFSYKIGSGQLDRFDPESDLQDRFSGRDIRERLRAMDPDHTGLWFYLHVVGDGEKESILAKFNFSTKDYTLYDTGDVPGTVLAFLAPGSEEPGYLLVHEERSDEGDQTSFVPFRVKNGKLHLLEGKPIKTSSSIQDARKIDISRNGFVRTVRKEGAHVRQNIFRAGVDKTHELPERGHSMEEQYTKIISMDPSVGNLLWLEVSGTGGEEGPVPYTCRVSSPPYTSSFSLFQFQLPEEMNVRILPSAPGDLYVLLKRASWSDPVYSYVYSTKSTRFQELMLPVGHYWTTSEQIWVSGSGKDTSGADGTEERSSGSEENVYDRIQEFRKAYGNRGQSIYLWHLLELKNRFSDHPEIEYLLALYYHGEKQFEEAEAHYKRAIKKKEDLRYIRSLARLHRDMGNLERALSTYQSVHDKTESVPAKVFLDQAHVLNELNRLEKARDLLRKGVKQHPDHPGIRYRLGRLLQKEPAKTKEVRKHFRYLQEHHGEYEHIDEVKEWLENNRASEPSD